MTCWGRTSIGLNHILVLGGDQFHTLTFLGRPSQKKHPVFKKNSTKRDHRPPVITIDLGNMRVWVTIDIGKLKGIIISMVIMFYVVITLKVDFAYI